MSVRTPEELFDTLSEDLIWRKKEISGLKLLTESSGASPDRQAALLRASVALLYAHWEGFVKHASLKYVEFVAFQRKTYAELAPHFVALGLRALLRQAGDSNKIGAHLSATEFFLNRLGERSSLPYKDAVSTQANLSSRVLKEIADTLGLDYSAFETKANLLDNGLLERRNTIAHGEYLAVSLANFRELSAEVVDMMDLYFAQISNAAILKGYLRSAA